MGEDDEKEVPKRKGRPKTRKDNDGNVVVEITELLVNVKLGRGDYQRNQFYSHIKVSPVSPWLIKVPIGELEDLDALDAVIDKLADVVAKQAIEQANKLVEMDKKGGDVAISISTPVRTVRSSTGMPTPLDSVGEEDNASEDDF